MNQITDEDKATLIELHLYETLYNIQKQTNDWFEDVYIKQDTHLSDNNLIAILEYHFKIAFCWVQIAESLGFKPKAKEYLEKIYNRYKEKGHKSIIINIRYDNINDRVRTDAEIEKVNNYQISLTNEILEELKNEEE